MTQQVSVRFKRDCRIEFTGTDLEVYGPFQVFDVVDLPEANAQVLEDLGYVEEVE
ncbi:MAG: hypothetical protein SVS85_00335 [Candidatus Nanohaloarchaea archaeon]|nr:hypothetical protein [Candidatus Nanohaloarchaea archaeon]